MGSVCFGEEGRGGGLGLVSLIRMEQTNFGPRLQCCGVIHVRLVTGNIMR